MSTKPILNIFKSYENDCFQTLEERSKDYVRWWNKKTNESVPTYLNKLAEDSFSSTHAAMLRLKNNMVYGDGIAMTTPNPALAALLSNIDGSEGKRSNVNQQLRLFVSDVVVHERICFYVVFSKSGKPLNIYHIPITNVRAGKVDDLLSEPSTYFVSKNWDTARPKYTEYPAFNPKKPAPVQLLVLQFNSLTNQYYNLPSYHSSLKSINGENELQVYYLNSLNNGMHIGAILDLIDNDQDEDSINKKDKDIQKSLTGLNGAGKLMITRSTDTSSRPQLQSFETSANHQSWMELNEQFMQKIITSHGGQPELAGISSAGVDLGGDANKLAISDLVFRRRITDHLQGLIVDGYNIILEVMGYGKKAIYIEDKPILPEEISNLQSPGEDDGTDVDFNGNIAGMSGKQNINLKRIVREFQKGNYTKEQALLLLTKSGLSEDDAYIFLGIEKENKTENANNA